MDDVKIAAVCMEAIPGAVQENLDRIEALTLKASASGAGVVCFPELSVTGYVRRSPGRVLAKHARIGQHILYAELKDEILQDVRGQ